MSQRKTLIRLLLFLLAIPQGMLGQTTNGTLFFISNAHLDTQWNWDVRTTINEYVRNTLQQNFTLLDKYPNLVFNHEGAIRYMWMKEYYPDLYAQLKEHVAQGRWHISGCAVDANDVMVPSAESVMRNWLYANQFFKKEFGVRGGYDVMLPDCFGFSYALPSLMHHCGFKGFHTAKLAWGLADYDQLPPFGIWQGVDGSQVYAVYKPGAYDSHEQYNKNMATDSEMASIIANNYDKYGVAAEIRYVGPRSDRGGGLQDNASQQGENTPYWLNLSAKTEGATTVKMATPDEIFDFLDQHKNSKYHVKNGELPMRTHGVGAYTSRTMLKRWNRKNELLADACEKAASLAQWLGVQAYPQTEINEAWVRNLWQSHHDGITGTSIPNAYYYSVGDYVLVNKSLAQTMATTAGSIVSWMNTQTEGLPVVVFNPLSFARTDIVEGKLKTDEKPDGIAVFCKDGTEVLSQISHYDETTGELTFIFAASVPSLGYATYDVRLGEASSMTSDLQASKRTRQLSNGQYRLTLSSTGNPMQLINMATGTNLLANSQLQMIYDHEDAWPSWEISYTDIQRQPELVDDNVTIELAEDGPLRKSFRVVREKNGSTFVQYVRMNALNNRIDIDTEADWQSRGRMLKACFKTPFGTPKATYDLSLGTIERGNRNSNQYEVQGHQWADLSTTDGSYGLSILNDCKYGWDKPDDYTLRLTLIHTPSTGNNYTYQANQDLGVNLFTYALFPHDGAWSQQTQMAAAQLNQPLLAFTAPKHDGTLNPKASLISLSTDQVSVKAVKKAEESDELIVRVYEWSGQHHDRVSMTFPADILSAREVNGLEESLGEATYDGRTLVFDIEKYQPKTFAVKLQTTGVQPSSTDETSTAIALPYNADVMSYDSKKNDVMGISDLAYPAEQIPDVLTTGGVAFTMGSRAGGDKNAVRCNQQTIDLTTAKGRKLYLLMASTNKNGAMAEIKIDGQTYHIEVPYYGGVTGQLASPYNTGTNYRQQDVALCTTHSHNISGNSNEAYRFLYIYKYALALPEHAQTLQLPTNNTLYLLAATTSDNPSDDITPLTTLNTYINYQELNYLEEGHCGQRLEPQTIAASQQISNNEAGKMAADNDEMTKWCVSGNQNQTPYLEYRFSEPMQICQWMVLNAGNEAGDYITKACKLQRYEGGRWVDVDVVTANRENKIVRGVTPFTTSRVRLQITQGEQQNFTTRINEFAVFGTPASTLSIEDLTVADTNHRRSLLLYGNTPNPCAGMTSIHCQVPPGVDKLTLHLTTIDGRQVCQQDYCVGPGDQQLTWRGMLPEGIYLYYLTAQSKSGTLHTNAKRLFASYH